MFTISTASLIKRVCVTGKISRFDDLSSIRRSDSAPQSWYNLHPEFLQNVVILFTDDAICLDLAPGQVFYRTLFKGRLLALGLIIFIVMLEGPREHLSLIQNEGL
jgi:hypothetical protein